MSVPAPDHSASGYSLSHAYWLAQAARAAYKTPEEAERQAREWGFDRFRHFTSPHTMPFPIEDTQAYVAASDRMVLVAFRGTESQQIRDWLTDTTTPPVPGPARKGFVHFGFHRALDVVHPQIRDTVAEFKDDDQTVWFTGHSLGGALAMLAGARMYFEAPNLTPHGVYTYGQPRTCDRLLATAYDAALKGRTFRFVNNNDIVPLVPPAPRSTTSTRFATSTPRAGSTTACPPSACSPTRSRVPPRTPSPPPATECATTPSTATSRTCATTSPDHGHAAAPEAHAPARPGRPPPPGTPPGTPRESCRIIVGARREQGTYVESEHQQTGRSTSTEKFEWFCDTVSNHVMPVRLSALHAAGFDAEVSELDLGALRLSTVSCSPVLSYRTTAHVRRGDPEHYQLALVTRGPFRIAQGDRQDSVATGNLVLTDTSRPSEGSSTEERSETVILQIPRSILPLRQDRVDELVAQGIRGDTGTGAILAGFLKTLVDHGPSCGPSELAGMGSVALDLATACLAQQLGSPRAAPAEVRAQLMLQRVTRFIEDNLGDPDLTPQAIADRHNISLRSLHSLFSGRSLSVAAHIRASRLERAREDLERVELSGVPVQAIGARWGFSGPSVFSRTFRNAYGVAPAEHRAVTVRARTGSGFEQS